MGVYLTISTFDLADTCENNFETNYHQSVFSTMSTFDSVDACERLDFGKNYLETNSHQSGSVNCTVYNVRISNSANASERVNSQPSKPICLQTSEKIDFVKNYLETNSYYV